MKTYSPLASIHRSQISTWLSTAALAAVSFLNAPAAQSAPYYLQANSPNTAAGNNINNVANYWSQTTGGGTNPGAMAGNDFSNNGWDIRVSPGSTAGSVTFLGNSLILTNGSASMRVAGGTATVGTINSLGGTGIYSGGAATLAVTTFTNAGNTTLVNSGASGTIFHLNSTTLSGGGDLILNSTTGTGRKIQLTISTGTGFDGDILWTGTNLPVLQFGNNLSLGGGLIATNAASRIFLDKAVTLASLTLNGTSLAAGTYTYSYLNTNYDTIFVDGGSGSITVVPPIQPGDVVSAQFAVSYQNKLTTAESAGFLPAANWNVVIPSGTSGSAPGLKDSTGATTAISLAWTNDGNGAVPRSGSSATPNGKLFSATLSAGSTSPGTYATVAISGIPFSSYSIYAYLASSQSGRSGKVKLDSGTLTNFSAQMFDSSTTFTEITSVVPNGNFIKWAGLSGPSHTITVQHNGAWAPVGITGLQIVEDAAPPVVSATATSFQAGNEPSKAIDASTATFWHSQWSPNQPLPQSITIDQGIVQNVACLKYLPRQDSGTAPGNGNITGYNIWISSDGTTYTKIVNAGSWDAGPALKIVNFPVVSARYVRLEATAGYGGWANAANIQLSSTPTYVANRVTVLSPAYCSNVTGNTTISIAAPGLTSATFKCWQAGGTHGTDSTVGTIALSGTNGTGSITFPANSYPHGPLTVRITATNGTITDNCYLQLYNTGGTVWNQGIPASAPAQAAGMNLVFSDDFNSMPTISSNGIGATYSAHKPDGGDFSAIPFTNPTGPNNPFSQVDSYLRIRADAAKNSTGLISSLRSDATGFWTRSPAYFECRFLAQSAPGTWPAFWLLTFNNDLTWTRPSDELDIIEAYGGEGPGHPNAPRSYMIVSHNWNQTPQPRISQSTNMATVGGTAGWTWASHTYGCLIGPVDTVYYLDNIEVGRHATGPVSKTDKFWFMINLAVGGNGWPVDLSRYNGLADMYVDWVRVYAAP